LINPATTNPTNRTPIQPGPFSRDRWTQAAIKPSTSQVSQASISEQPGVIKNVTPAPDKTGVPSAA
jgi:hypothetical protein